MTGSDLFGTCAEHVEPGQCCLGCKLSSGFMVSMLLGLVILGAYVLAWPIFLSSLVWHLAGICFVQVGRLERCCCCLGGLLCDGSGTNDAVWMVIILFYQDVLLATALGHAVDITFL